MGFVSDAFGKGGSDAADEAADAQVYSNQLAINEMRRQFDETQQNLRPFMEIGAADNYLPEFLWKARSGTSPEGLDDRLGRIFGSNAFRKLYGERERAVENQLSQTGLMRSGQALRSAANIPTELGMAIENLIYGRNMDLLGSAQNAAAGLGALGRDASSGIASLYRDQGQAVGQGILQGQQADAKAGQNIINTGLAAASLFFSDERMKENMEPIGSVAGLTLYEWDWKSEVSPIIGQMSIGFSAQEVERKHPDCVVEIAGRKAIAYPRLIEKLQDQLNKESGNAHSVH